MRFENLKDEHIEQIREINDRQEKFDLNKAFVASGVVVDESDRVVAFGGIKPIYEVVFIVDLDRSKRDRIEAIRQLLPFGKSRSAQKGVEHWHVFVSEPEFIEVLKKHFGFKKCEGDALILEL